MSTHPGAIWHRVDLQCHTPRDRGWAGSPALPGGDPASEQARRDWAQSFVTAAVERSLSIVAVTDHHDIAFLPYICDAAKADGRLLVLPGVEVTCRDAVQCLALFDPNTDHAILQRFLTKLSSVTASPDSSEKTAQTRECGLTVAELFERVSEDTLVASNLILLPHFSNDSAHKSLNSPGFAARAKDLPIDAVYVECPFEDLTAGTLAKIQGRQPDWGDKRRAIVVTGDNKRASWDRLGLYECWMRLGEPSIEALRQAFLADEARISYTRPNTPSERIIELEVKSTLTGTDPIIILFNEGFNSFIGGRGSGKSAILEYLAFGLGKSENDRTSSDSKGPRRREREAALIHDTLANGWVRVTIERSGVQEIWLRRGDKPEEISVTIAGIVENYTATLAQKRFPARTFHQKELSTTMVDPATAADNITMIAAAESIETRQRLDSALVSSKRRVSAAIINLASYWQSLVELENANITVSDLQRRIESVAGQLGREGVKREDIDTMEDARRFDRGQNYLSDLKNSISTQAAEIKRISNWTPPQFAISEHETLPFSNLPQMLLALEGLQDRIKGFSDGILQELRNIEGVRQAFESEFSTEKIAFDVKYEQYKSRQFQHKALISENEQLASQLKIALENQTRAANSVRDKSLAQEEFDSSRQELMRLVGERLGILRSSAMQIAEKSDGALNARTSRDKRPADCIAALCALLENSRFREPEERCKEWVSSMYAEVDAPNWETVCMQLLEVYRSKIMAGSPPEAPPAIAEAVKRVFSGGAGTLTDQQAAKVYSNINETTLTSVICATPRDSITLTYINEGQSIQFEKASPGQQASALLRLLLRQEAGTLIIDQPEDDLDNRVMMEIVRLIRTSKTTRQLIFATHNSNLVVNGDADKIIVMRATAPEDRAPASAAKIRVEIDGAIETPAVRDEITKIMEGGMSAFALRSRKYAK